MKRREKNHVISTATTTRQLKRRNKKQKSAQAWIKNNLSCTECGGTGLSGILDCPKCGYDEQGKAARQGTIIVKEIL